ncbi:hypothetical protein [Bradyrhizobium sp. Bra78]|uniref:hypothetical protein n=1 Tax=Bradyrhizobium sp. Bra78 TaxID=2926010 RepID=UPI0021C6E28F|nr:hypothetical protein [Bradyrhizobium sp. Bra78]
MLRRVTTILLWLTLNVAAAGAEAPPEFANGIVPVMANLRTAMSYARTGNIALAQIEISDALVGWKQLQHFKGTAIPPYPPVALDAFLTTGREQLIAADRALDRGDADSAIREVQGLRRALRELRRHSGLYDLSDCVFELGPAMTTLRDEATRFGEQLPHRAEGTVAAASVFGDRLQRCNDWASVEISKQSEFRRLIDGAIASSGEISRAALSGDAPLVHRYLIELQSFAQLLDFRFG